MLTKFLICCALLSQAQAARKKASDLAQALVDEGAAEKKGDAAVDTKAVEQEVAIGNKTEGWWRCCNCPTTSGIVSKDGIRPKSKTYWWINSFRGCSSQTITEVKETRTE